MQPLGGRTERTGGVGWRHSRGYVTLFWAKNVLPPYQVSNLYAVEEKKMHEFNENKKQPE